MRSRVGGQEAGGGRKKIGNGQFRWAYAEAACLFLRSSERARQWKQKAEKKHGSAKALAILAARLARAVYHMLRKQEAFDEERFCFSDTSRIYQREARAKAGHSSEVGDIESQQVRYSMRMADGDQARVMNLLPDDPNRPDGGFPRQIDVGCFRQQGERRFEPCCLGLGVYG